MKILRNLLVTIMCIGLFGCAGIDITTDNTHAVLIMLEIAASEAGCEVAKIPDPGADRALRNFYILARTGELSDDAIKQLNSTLSEYTLDRPTLIPNLIRLMSLIDVDFNAEETALDELRVIAPEYFDAIERGYMSGFDICQN